MTIAPGTRLGPYEIVAPLGAGGMGEVYRAHDPRLGRDVALKVLSPALAMQPAHREPLLREARAAAALNHPNICTVHEIGTADGQDYIALEYIEGETLEQLVTRGGLPLERLLELALALAEALDYAHRKGIIHRDLKPSNVMVSALGIPKILDFGLAKVAAGETPGEAVTRTRLTAEGAVRGTVAFMSPEQALGREVDARSDVFSFGSLLYELATCRPAFSGATPMEVLNAVVNKEPAPVQRLRPDLPPGWAQVIDKALRKDPAERYQHMADLAADLRHLTRQSGQAAEAARAAARRTPLVRAPRRNVAIVAVAAVLTLVSAFLAYRWRDSAATVPVAGPVAVMYFENLADRSDKDSLGRMLTSLLTTELSRSAGLQVVSSQRLYDVATELRRAEGPLDRSVATEVARRARAGSMVIGQVARAGDRLMVTTEVVEVKGGRLLGSHRAEGRSVDDLFSLAEALGQQVRRDLEPAVPAAVVPGELTRSLTQSVDAYRAYVRGEARVERSDYTGAAAEFREAVRLDPEFAVAYYRLSQAAGNAGDTSESQEAALRALALADRLPTRYQDLVKARALPVTSAARVPLLEAALQRDPSNPDALSLLGEEYAHSPRDNDPERVVALRERLFGLGRQSFAVCEEQAQMYALMGKPEKAEEMVAFIDARWPTQAPYTRAWLSAFAGQADAALRLLERAPEPAPVVSAYLLSEISEVVGRWDLAESAVARDLGQGHWRARDLRTRGQFFVHRGAFDRAVETYRQAGGAEPLTQGRGWAGAVRASGFRALAELAALRGDLADAKREMARALAIQPENPRWLFFAGRFAASDGDLGAAQEHLAALRRLLGTTRHVTRDLYHDALEAEIALASRRPEAARALAEKVANSPRRVLDYWSDGSFVSAAFRDTLARAYLALGRKQDAARALDALVNSGFERVHHPVLYVRALYTLGKLQIELGEGARGRDLLKQFLDHWGNADWDLPEVGDARRLLRPTATPAPR